MLKAFPSYCGERILAAFTPRIPVNWIVFTLLAFTLLEKEGASVAQTTSIIQQENGVNGRNEVNNQAVYLPSNLKENITVLYEKKRIMVSLSWNPPNVTGNITLREYDLSVTLSGKQTNKKCKDFTFVHQSLAPDVTFFEIPYDEIGPEKKVIHFGCSFDVKLKVFFNKYLKMNPTEINKTFTIPYCLKGNCACEAPLSPPTDVTVNASQSIAFVSWKYPKASKNVSHFSVLLSTPHRDNSYRFIKEAAFDYTNNESYEAEINLTDHKEYGINDVKNYRITVFAVDDIYCKRSNVSILLAYLPTDLKENITVLYEKKRIMVSLSWNPPNVTGNITLTKYDLTFKVSDNQTKPCKDFTFVHQYLSPDVTFFEIPYDEIGPLKKVIYFGCSFEVKLKAVFNKYVKKNLTEIKKTFTIPYCMKGNCACEAPLSPPTDVTVNASQSTAFVSWKYPKASKNVSHFSVLLSTPHRDNSYRFIKEASFDYTNNENYEAEINLTDHNDDKEYGINDVKNYRITVFAIDDIYCRRSNVSILLDCSDDSCFCKAPSLKAPENVTVVVQPEEKKMVANIQWSYESSSLAYVKNFVLETSEKKIDFNHQSTYSAENNSFARSLNCDKPEMKLVIRAMDERSCYGPKEEKTFHCPVLPPLPQEDKNPLLAVIMVCLIAFVLLAVFLSIKYCKNRLIFHSEKPEFNHGSVISDMSRDTHFTYLSLEHEHTNEIYVPLEIAEAREKADKYETLFCRLILGKEIGKGAFGRVHIATTDTINGIQGKITVAVKQLKDDLDDMEKKDFLAEIEMMKKVGKHPNVVTMLACCTLQQPFCMIMEYVPCGDLLRYLRKLRAQYELRSRLNCQNIISSTLGHDGSSLFSNVSGVGSFNNDSAQPLLPYHKCSTASDNYPPKDYIVATQSTKEEDDECFLNIVPNGGVIESSCNYIVKKKVHQYLPGSYISIPKTPEIECYLNAEELHSFASQIAEGMCHLASKGITHRDLAARNVLIDENRTLKISDFGLSRSGSIYITRNGGRVPLRWLSIEAIKKNLYSTKSDVWAFGVVLWEICTLGGFPYPSIEDDNVLHYLLEGNRLDKPTNCSHEFYSVMKLCWAEDPFVRPTFPELRIMLDKMKEEPHVYVNFDVTGNTPLPPSELEVNRDSNESTILNETI